MRKAHMLTLGALVAVAVALATQPGMALADSAAPPGPGEVGGGANPTELLVVAGVLLFAVVAAFLIVGGSRLGEYIARLLRDSKRRG